MFRERDKPMLVRVSSKLTLAGLAFLAVAMNGAVLLVIDLLFDQPTVTITVVVMVLVYTGLWFGLGLTRRLTRERATEMTPPAAILDIDGTLVDSNYQHALAWYRAFRLHGVTLPVWRCHRAIGMGGDQLVKHLAGEGFDQEQGDTVRTEEHALFAQLRHEVQPFAGARGLIEDLKARGSKVVISSSAKAEDLQHYLDLLDARELVDGWTDSSTVERTKPAPDLIAAALEMVGGGPGVMIGDSTWDVEAAKQLKVPTICVRTGGFGADELLEAGAESVHDSIVDLRERLDDTPFG